MPDLPLVCIHDLLIPEVAPSPASIASRAPPPPTPKVQSVYSRASMAHRATPVTPPATATDRVIVGDAPPALTLEQLLRERKQLHKSYRGHLVKEKSVTFCTHTAVSLLGASLKLERALRTIPASIRTQPAPVLQYVQAMVAAALAENARVGEHLARLESGSVSEGMAATPAAGIFGATLRVRAAELKMELDWIVAARLEARETLAVELEARRQLRDTQRTWMVGLHAEMKCDYYRRKLVAARDELQTLARAAPLLLERTARKAHRECGRATQLSVQLRRGAMETKMVAIPQAIMCRSAMRAMVIQLQKETARLMATAQ